MWCQITENQVGGTVSGTVRYCQRYCAVLCGTVKKDGIQNRTGDLFRPDYFFGLEVVFFGCCFTLRKDREKKRGGSREKKKRWREIEKKGENSFSFSFFFTVFRPPLFFLSVSSSLCLFLFIPLYFSLFRVLPLVHRSPAAHVA